MQVTNKEPQNNNAEIKIKPWAEFAIGIIALTFALNDGLYKVSIPDLVSIAALTDSLIFKGAGANALLNLIASTTNN